MSGLGLDITEVSVTAKLRDEKFSVIAIGTTTGLFADALNADPQSGTGDHAPFCSIDGVSGQGIRIASATDGVDRQGVPPSGISTAICETIEEVVMAVTVELVPAGDTVPHTEVLTPPFVGLPLPPEGETLDLVFEVKFTGIECNKELQERSVSGTVDAIVDGALGASQAVMMSQPSCDNEPPVAMCRDVTAEADSNCEGMVTTEVMDDGSFDPDAGDTMTFTLDPSEPYPLGTTTVTLTVTDDSGAFDTCTATVTVDGRETMCPLEDGDFGELGSSTLGDNEPDGFDDTCEPNCNEGGMADIEPGTSVDTDGDGLIDDGDQDGDGVVNLEDNCPRTANREQDDRDDDGVGDAGDNCPDEANAHQADSDQDGVGDACEAESWVARRCGSGLCGVIGMAPLALLLMFPLMRWTLKRSRN